MILNLAFIVYWMVLFRVTLLVSGCVQFFEIPSVLRSHLFLNINIGLFLILGEPLDLSLTTIIFFLTLLYDDILKFYFNILLLILQFIVKSVRRVLFRCARHRQRCTSVWVFIASELIVKIGLYWITRQRQIKVDLRHYWYIGWHHKLVIELFTYEDQNNLELWE